MLQHPLGCWKVDRCRWPVYRLMKGYFTLITEYNSIGFGGFWFIGTGSFLKGGQGVQMGYCLVIRVWLPVSRR
ncbi:hypothetical protein O181_049167 [Austropuccinia psidii MF-1]|uniref:Uncharacterized protein n=1 Tax=Austropuccinia psidii MF-1 TaxID=1389203 RepID=A0A9Q3DWG8_9BASI|nr:hypothetical protein [Austropuccinia psidii MF-1]